ncbi:MAG: glycoside hydrolase family 25 protein [Clostridia bacterium]|nr:glycoside hydrolase family 25 protein [Clostridia bacterium]
MSGKREYSLIEKISLMSFRGKITLIIIAVVIVIGILTGTYLAFTNEETEDSIEETIATEFQENEIIVVPINPEATVTSNTHPEDEEIKKLEQEAEPEKTVKYQNKEVVIPKTKVASANSTEDSQKQKTGGETISAEQAVSQFENDGQSVGIDVSAHQGVIDWKQVKDSGIEFAMIRCGFRGNSEGGIFQDRYFKDNINGAVKNGVFVGIYFYSTAVNEDEAIQEAAWVVNTIKSYRITYPVAYDFEDFGKYRCAGVSGEQATSNAIAFLNYVKSSGYTPMMYSNKSDISSRFNKARLSSYKFWLAHYTTNTNYTGSYQMWQYTSNGSVSGISSRVDMNIAYFRFSSVAEPKHTHDFTNGTIITTSDSKVATCTENGIKYIRCKDCSESQKIEIPAFGHNFDNWEIVEEATTEKEGKEVRKCKNCNVVEERIIKKLTNNINTNTDVNTNTNTNITNTETNTIEDNNTLNNTNTNYIENTVVVDSETDNSVESNSEETNSSEENPVNTDEEPIINNDSTDVNSADNTDEQILT